MLIHVDVGIPNPLGRSLHVFVTTANSRARSMTSSKPTATKIPSSGIARALVVGVNPTPGTPIHTYIYVHYVM